MAEEIFRRYGEAGTSLRSLARALTAEGVAGPRRGAWDNVTLSRILHSPVYVMADREVCWHYLAQGVPVAQPAEAFDGTHGCVLIGKRSGGPEARRLSLAVHRGLVPAGLWLRVQDKLAGNRQLDRSRAGKYSWLTGLLKCGRCGYALRINRDRRTGECRLLCSGRSNYGLCDASVKADLRELEGAVEEALEEVLSRCPEEPADRDGTAGKLAEAEEKIGRLVAALAESSAVSAAYIGREIDRLHRRKEELERRPPRRYARLRFGPLTPEEKRLVAGEFLDRIEIDGEEAVLRWRA